MPTPSADDATDATACLAHLVRRRLVDPEGAALTPLTGGISNDVFAVAGADGRELVVKRALTRLRVAGLWVASPARTSTEAAALRLAGRLTPEAVPDVVDLDAGYLVITRAPRTWTTWKDDLMAGRVDPGVAEALGSVLARWQRRTASGVDPASLSDPSGVSGQQVRARLAELTGFMEQRVRPFHRAVRDVHPDLADQVDTTLSIMLGQSACLVHGDFTPKNMIVAPSPGASGGTGNAKGGHRPLWVLDWEIAHLGDPTFDPGSLIAHLIIKSVHRPPSAAGYRECAQLFLAALAAGTAGAVSVDPAQLVRQVGCMLLARVDGTSPMPYLSEPSRTRVRALGRALLLEPVDNVLTTWDILR